jgi:magnesium transporter
MPSRLLVKQRDRVVDHPADQLSELRGEHPCWLDIADPKSEEFDLVAKELNLHPLAVEDARHGHQRPKIDEYENHYFIVFYAIETPSPGMMVFHEVAIFVAQNAIVTVHEGDFAARQQVEKRFREGRLNTTGLLLHALFDTMVDQYFEVADQFGERIELLEEFIASASGRDTRDTQTPLKELFLVKRDLLQLRKRIAPERDVLQVLVRGDIRELRETGRRAYFQDVYDHIIRVTDEIDTFRDLISNVIDAYLAAASNRLNEVLKVLTSVATVLLVLTVFTSFFGQNWEAIPYASPTFFWLSTALAVVGAIALAWYFRRRGWL